MFQKSFIDVVREIRADPTGPQYGMFGSKLILAAIQSNFGQFEAGDSAAATDPGTGGSSMGEARRHGYRSGTAVELQAGFGSAFVCADYLDVKAPFLE